MMAWWQQLEMRERYTLVIGSVIALLLILMLIIDSHLSTKNKLAQGLSELESTHVWMQRAAAQITASNPLQKKDSSNQSLLTLVDTSTKRSNLATAVKRIQPEGSDKVKIWLEDAPLNQVTRTLADLDRNYGVRTHALTFERTKKPGSVSGNITLTRSH